MTEVSNSFTQMSIDLKKFRIRIHKKSLHLIGDPEYIQLLVNTRNKQVAIRAVEKEQIDFQAYKVDQTRIESDFSFEIYSQAFIKKLCKEFNCFDKECSYRLTGTAIRSEKVAVFHLDSLQKIEL